MQEAGTGCRKVFQAEGAESSEACKTRERVL